QQCRLKLGDQLADLVGLLTQPQPERRYRLIVAAPSGMQLFAHVADRLDQPRFYKRMNVLRRQLIEIAVIDGSISKRLCQPAGDGVGLLASEHARGRQSLS